MHIFPKNSHWKDCLPHNIILPPLYYTDHINMDLLLGSLFCSIDLCAVFFLCVCVCVCVPLLNCFDYHNIVIWYEIREYDTFSFVFLFHCFGFSGSFVALYKFKNFVPALWKMTFNRDFTESVRTSLVAQTVRRLPTMWETWVRSLGWEDPLEKERATHSSTLAWKIPWTEEPGRPQSVGSQRVGHDWETKLPLSLNL